MEPQRTVGIDSAFFCQSSIVFFFDLKTLVAFGQANMGAKKFDPFCFA
jgi:hypothetical protein